jgi:hypothetical protein
MRLSRTDSTEGSIVVSIKGSVVAALRLWELADKLSRVLGQRRDTPDNEKWSGRWESNPQGRRCRTEKTSGFVRSLIPSVIGV